MGHDDPRLRWSIRRPKWKQINVQVLEPARPGRHHRLAKRVLAITFIHHPSCGFAGICDESGTEMEAIAIAGKLPALNP
jgi:hypothetical protein